MITFTIEKKINAPAKKIWGTISNFSIPAAPSFSVDVLEIGDSKNNGVGTLRNIKIRRNHFIERLIEVNPASMTLVYEILASKILKKYTGTITLIPQENVSKIKWTVNFTPSFFGTGWIIKIGVKRTLYYIIDEINTVYR